MQLHHKKVFLFLLVFAGFSARVQGQVLSLQDCINYALKNNSNIAVSKLEQANVEQQIINARARALPQVNVNASGTDNYALPVFVVPAGTFGSSGGSDAPQKITAGVKYVGVATVEATQAIFDKSVLDGLKATTAGRTYAALNTNLSEEDVINQVASAYYNILATGEQLKIEDSTIAKITRLQNATQVSLDNGLAKKTDLDRIKVRLINLETQKDMLDNKLVQQTNTLKLLMGEPIESSFAISAISLKEVENVVGTTTYSGTFNLASRTEIKLLDAQNELLELQKKTVQAERYPRLSAFFNYNYNASSTNLGDYFKKGGGDVYYPTGGFGLRLNVPIFDGFGRKSRIAMDQIQIDELKRRTEYTKLQLSAGWSNANAQLKNSVNSIRRQKQNRLLAEDVFTATQTNYDLGLASLTDLLDAQTSYLDAQNNFTQSLLNYKIAEVEILRSQGNIRSLIK